VHFETDICFLHSVLFNNTVNRTPLLLLITPNLLT
jgi:hypothetical protein